MDKSAKTTWVKNSQRLSNEYDLLDKKKSMSALHKDKDHRRHQLALSKSTEDSKRSTWKNLQEIRVMYGHVRNVLHGLDEDSVLSNTTLTMLEKFEEKLTAFKFVMRSEFDSLLVQEKSFLKDISNLNSDIDEWENPNSTHNESALKAANQEKNMGRQTRDIERKYIIGTIDRKITAIGRYGKWDNRDHDVFLKVWNQVIDKDHQNFNDDLTDQKDSIQLSPPQRSMILRKLSVCALGKQQDEMEEHLNWYLHYMYLTLYKKKLVTEWKKDSKTAQIQRNEEVLSSETMDHLEYQRTKKIDECPGKVNQEQRMATKERIAAWREEQVSKKESENREKVDKIARQKELEIEDEKKRRLKSKAQIEEWKEAVEMSKTASNDSAEKSTSSEIDYEKMRRWQERDIELAKVKLSKTELVNEQLRDRDRRTKEAAAAVGVTAKRDFSRLLAPTKAFETSKIDFEDLEHNRSQYTAHSAPIAMNGRDLQFSGRATPSWINKAMY